MKRVSIIIATLMLLIPVTAMAQVDYNEATPYFKPEQMPDMRAFLPGPPAEGSIEMQYDEAKYLWVKK